jgi:hypothetical protein
VQPGIGERDVDAAEAPDRSRHRALQRAGVGHVRLEDGAAVPQPRGQLLQPLGLQADERDVRALGVQPLRRSGADAARRARDEDGAPGDVLGL